jgi:hypothetical protein
MDMMQDSGKRIQRWLAFWGIFIAKQITAIICPRRDEHEVKFLKTAFPIIRNGNPFQ